MSQIGQMMHFHSRLLSIYEIKGLNPLLEIIMVLHLIYFLGDFCLCTPLQTV